MPSRASCKGMPTTADVVCSHFPEPQVGVVLVGAARTFVQPLVHRTLRTNLMEAFGGTITLFAWLKLQDGSGDPNKRRLDHANVGAVLEALQYVSAAAKRVVKKISDDAPEHGCPHTTRFNTAFLAQAANRWEAWRLVREFENGGGSRLDYYIYTRPDLAWPIAVRPHCFWNLQGYARVWDWVFMMPGHALEAFMNLPQRCIHAICNDYQGAEAKRALLKFAPLDPKTHQRQCCRFTDMHPWPEQLGDLSATVTRTSGTITKGRYGYYETRFERDPLMSLNDTSSRFFGTRRPMASVLQKSAVITHSITSLSPCANT